MAHPAAAVLANLGPKFATPPHEPAPRTETANRSPVARRFLSVARTGSFSPSATERRITQSAFTRRIKSLEQGVGVALIDRSSYPTRLTAAGQQFLATAQEATSSLLNARQALCQAARSDRRLLRFAVQRSLASGSLARLPLSRDDLLTHVRANNLHDCVRGL